MNLTTGNHTFKSLLFGVAMAAPLVVLASDPPMVINLGVAGSWYEPATDGQGFSIEVVPTSNSLVAYWFTYTLSGDGPDWFIAVGDISGAEATLTVYETSGGVFDTPSEVSTTVWGTARLAFTNCTTASLEYESTGGEVSGSIPLTRLTPDVSCTQSLTAAQTTFVSRNNRWIDGQGDWVFQGCVSLSANESHGDELFVFEDDTLHFEIDRYDSPDCTGPTTVWIMDFRVRRIDKYTASLNGEAVIVNRVIMVDTETAEETKQIFFFNDDGQPPLMTHGTLDSPPDEDGFPSELPDLFFQLQP